MLRPIQRIRSLPRTAQAGIALMAVLILALAPGLVEVRISTLLSLGNVGAYAILAVGIVMIYRASKVLNLAHGAMVMFPPYVVLFLSSGDANLAQRLLVSAIPAVAVASLITTFIRRPVGRIVVVLSESGSRMLSGDRVPGPLRRLTPVVAWARWPKVALGIIWTVSTIASLTALTWIASSGLPVPVALAIGVIAGGGLGYLVERVFVRALRAQGPTAQTVGTVAALGLVVAVSAKVFGTSALIGPTIFPDRYIEVSESSIKWGEIGLFVMAMMLTLGLILLFKKTDLGLIMRGTAENRRAAALMGVDPDRITALTWIIGGLLAGTSGILLASVTNLHPYVLSLQALPAFVAALLAGMASLAGSVVGAAIVGITFSVFPALGALDKIQGGAQLFLAVIAVTVMVTRGQRIAAGDVRSEAVAAAGARGQLRGLGGLERARRPLTILGVLTWFAFPFLPFVQTSLVSNANRAAAFAMIAVSLVILIGWVGQISLGHAALVGIGAYGTGWIAGGLGIPFPLSLPLAALVGAGVAALLGMVAVRVRGLFLAVATLIFSWMGTEFLFRQEWFTKHFRIDATSIGREGAFPYFDFTQPRTMYYIVWAIVFIVVLGAANLRDSKTGRAFFAVQGSEMAASSLGVDVTRYKVVAFMVSGFLAAGAGNLIMTDSRVVNPDSFAFTSSLLFVAFAVVGGLRSLGGAVGAGLLFALLEELFFRIQFLGGYLEVFSAALLAVVLLAYPGGLAALGGQIAHMLGRRAWLLRGLARADYGIDVFLADVTWAKNRLADKIRERVEAPAFEHARVLSSAVPAPAPPVEALPAISGGATPALLEGGRPMPANREDRDLVVRSQNVTVRFGGLTAVNDVTMEVREGEIVGLIGPNGAGKTVSFNSIAGIVIPTEGRVFLYGKDVTNEPVHERAKLGIARTFQVLQLFPALTIFDNLLVATHLHNDTGLLAHVTASKPAVEAEREARRRVLEVVELLGLEDVVDTYPGDLPFGTLRMVEVARALVTGLKFIMLDEAFSGLDDTETENLLQSLLKVRDLGITILLIEHDVKLVMSVSDYVYVLDRGSLIAEGPPTSVQRDPAVIAAYIGKTPDAEERS